MPVPSPSASPALGSTSVLLALSCLLSGGCGPEPTAIVDAGAADVATTDRAAPDHRERDAARDAGTADLSTADRPADLDARIGLDLDSPDAASSSTGEAHPVASRIRRDGYNVRIGERRTARSRWLADQLSRTD